MTEATPPRPRRTDDMVLEAAEKLLSEHGYEASAADIVAHYIHWMDGYELAKELDNYCYWAIDAQTVEMLDDLPSRVERILEKAQKAWVEAYNIQPKLPAGTAIDRGVIAGVCKHSPAKYLVKETGCTHEGRHLLVPFEEAEAQAKATEGAPK